MFIDMGKNFFDAITIDLSLFFYLFFFLVKGTIGWRITWDLVTPEEGDDVIAVYYKSPDVEKEDKLKRGERRVFFFVSSSHTHKKKDGALTLSICRRRLLCDYANANNQHLRERESTAQHNRRWVVAHDL